jgi:hypothetical protein
MTPPPVRTRDAHLPFLIAALCVAAAPHAVRVPLWIVIGCALCWTWALIANRGGLPRPGRKGRLGLTLIAFAGAMGWFHFRFDRDVGVALLTVMVGLKPFEAF